MKLAALSLALALAACASGAPDLDVAQVEATCARWCAVSYPACAFDGAIVPPKTEALASCQATYLTCVLTCPPR